MPDRVKQEVEQYLNSLSTMKAEFVQVAPDGGIAAGTFYLSRPGKLRWEYKPPVPVLILVNGSIVTHYDSELKEASYLPSEDTLAGYLARPKIELGGDVVVSDYEQRAGLLRFSLQEKGKKDHGTLTVVMAENPLQMRKLEITDTSGNQTNIAFEKAQFGLPLKDSLFVLANPALFNDRRK
jgi:outer membrane lipoprotein-sorting protein